MTVTTLADIENGIGNTPSNASSFLVTRIAELQYKQLDQFDVEDIRICIGQDGLWKNKSLRILISLAIVELDKNLLAEGDMYEGDLLESVFRVRSEFWMKNKDLHEQVILLFERSRDHLNLQSVSERIRKELFESFSAFKAIS